MVLDDESCPYVTINTQRIVQIFMLTIRSIICSGGVSTGNGHYPSRHSSSYLLLRRYPCAPEEHLKNLAEVLTDLSNHRLRLKQEKCNFMQDRVLGACALHIDAEGVHTTPNKVEAITCS